MFRRFAVITQSKTNLREERELLINLNHIECISVLCAVNGDKKTVIRMMQRRNDGDVMEYESAVEYEYLSAALDGMRF